MEPKARRRTNRRGGGRVARLGLLLAALGLALVACRRETPRAAAEPVKSAAAGVVSAVTPSASAPGASAELPAWRRAFLWRLASPHASYLLGTIHIPDRRLKVLPPAVERAFTESGAFYGEIPLDAATQARLSAEFLLPGDQHLGDVLPPDLHDRVAREWSRRGLAFAPFDRMKPWVVSVQIPLLDRFALLAEQPPLDAALYSRAVTAGKEVGGLETAAEQLAVFDELATSQQIALLRETLDLLDRYRREGRDPTTELLSAYLSAEEAQIVRRLDEEFDPADPLDVEIRRRLFTTRNARMAERIVAKVRASPERSFLFAVGAGHLVGKDGLVARLAQAGLRPLRVAE